MLFYARWIIPGILIAAIIEVLRMIVEEMTRYVIS